MKCLESGHKSFSQELLMDINTDGLPLFHSSNSEIWPILGRCPNLNNDRPFVIGIFGSEYGKPKSLEDYLEDYLNDLADLTANGLQYEGQMYSVRIDKNILYAVAHAFIKCIIGHCGRSACERCDQEGETEGTQVCFSPVRGNLRTDQSFYDQVDAHHHVGVSPLTRTGTRMVSQFVLDPLHLLDLGVTKRFFRYILFKGKTGVRLSAAKVDKLPERLEIMANCLPSEFSRKARSFKFFRKFKAKELRMLLLYIGPLLLRRILPENLYKTFMLLHVAAVILRNEELLSRKL